MQIFEASRKRIKLKERKDGLERELKELSEEIERLESVMIDLYISEGVNSVKIEGVTVTLEKRKSVKCNQSAELVRWLEEKGYHEVFNKPINTNSLSSLINGSKAKGTEAMPADELKEIGNNVKFEPLYRFSLRRV